jgi:hypothetical protein
MLKKTKVTLVLSFALILCATPVVFGADLQAEQVASVRPARGSASYTPVGAVTGEVNRVAGVKDFCSLYGVPFYAITDWFMGQEWYANYQDPEEYGCVDVWPFEVITVNFNIVVDHAFTFDVQGFVLDADLSDPTCPVPGGVLCQTPMYQVAIPGAGHWIISLPMVDMCCVYGVYFAAIYLPDDISAELADAVSEDDLTDVCRSYNDYGNGWEDLVVQWGWPGEMLLWSEGYTAPQNDCPPETEQMFLHAEDGLLQSLNFHLENLHLHSLQGILEPGIPPESTLWHELYPHYCQVYHLGMWEDNGDGELSPCDMVGMEQIEPPGEFHYYHVKEVTITIVLSPEEPPFDTMYLEFTGGYNLGILTQPICTWWHEVRPTFCNWYHLSNWYDQGSGYLDECDYVELTDTDGGLTYWHVEDVATDILLKRESFDPLGSQWHQIWPYYCQKYQLTSWEDNGDGILSPSDQLDMVLKDEEGNPTGPISWYHIDEVTTTIFVVEKTPTEQWFIRGDVDENGVVDVNDLARCYDGPPFSCDDAVDFNDDGIMELPDCDRLNNYLFAGGPPPAPPYPNCGPDPTPDGLGCADFPPCPYGHDFSGKTMILEYLGMSDSLITEPESTMWHEKYPVYCDTFHLSYWEDDGDGFLSISDQIYLMNTETGLEGYYHVYEICRDLYLTRKPYETQWHELYPIYCNWYHVDDWFDNGNSVLDSCDTLVLRNKETEEVDTVHVVNKTVTIILESLETYDTMAVEWVYEGVEDPRIFLANPVCNILHEIWPAFSRMYHLSSWIDNGDGFLSVCDTIDITDLETEEVTWWHVIDVATDITVEMPPEENHPPDIIQPDTLYGYNDCDTVIYTFDGVDPDGDPILDDASLAIEPPCGTFSVTRLTGHGTSQGTWEVTWATTGCQYCITYMIIVDLTDDQGATSWCTTYCHLDENLPPDIDQPDFLEGYVDDVVTYDITGTDPEGDVILDAASIDIQPGCGSGYSITRTSGHGTSSGTWQITWNTDGCTPCDTHMVIHDLTDVCDNTSYCTTYVHLSESNWYWKPPYDDYAPNGMVDIDQKQDGWIKAETEQWSFCGPVAVANCFKWYDSKYNVPPGAPGDGMDQFPLVRQYIDVLGGMICPWDDHDPWNVDHPVTPWLFGATPPPPPTLPQPFVPGPQPPGPMPPWGELVERLAWYLNTDGVQMEYCEHSGTNIMEMQAGIDAWFRSEMFEDNSTLADTLYERTWPQPTFAWVETLVEKCQDVILLLGFWFEDPPGSGEWWRIGGHYVTVAGVNSEDFMIAFSDPFIDAHEMGMAPGRVADGFIIPHPHGSHDPTVHNDEGNVCHDIYMVDTLPISPGGLWWLPEYAIMFDPLYWSWNFSNQNVPDEFVPVTRPWNEISPIFTEVEYAIEISPWEYPPYCGDVNCDGVVNIADVVYLVTYLFLNGPLPCIMVKADVNHDGVVNIADVVYLVTYLFLNGPPPQCYDP